MIIVIVSFGLIAVGVMLVIYGTVAKNRWGINTDPVSCPRFRNTLSPQGRKPVTPQQAMWGGWVCPTCGIEVDKWGREVTSSGHSRSPNSARQDLDAEEFLREGSLFSQHRFIFARRYYSVGWEWGHQRRLSVYADRMAGCHGCRCRLVGNSGVCHTLLFRYDLYSQEVLPQ